MARTSRQAAKSAVQSVISGRGRGLALALAVVIASWHGTVLARAAGGRDLALGRPLVGSSPNASSYSTKSAVDRKASVRRSRIVRHPWVYVDLGSIYKIRRVVLKWQWAAAKTYRVQVSDDALHWTTMYSSARRFGRLDDLRGLSGTGRYVRLYESVRGLRRGHALRKFSVYGVKAHDLALARPVAASSVESPSYAPANAVDGKLSTRWSSAFSDPQWIYVDLGSTYKVTEVLLNWEAAYAKAYRVQVSRDAVHWSTIYSTTSGTGGVNDVRGLSGTGRYVRMYGTVRATRWGYSLWGFSVYGTPVATTAGASGSSTPTEPTPVVAGSSNGAPVATAAGTSGSSTPAQPLPVASGSSNAGGSTSQPSTPTTPPAGGAVLPYGSVPGSWSKMVFDDEFDAPETWGSVWSQDRWNSTGQMNNVFTDPNNVTVSGGALNLKLSSSTDGAYVSTFASDGGGGFMMGYGYAEARIFLPVKNGQLAGWPAWWIVGTNWPADGEADIVEGLDGAATSNYHYSLGGTDQTNNSNTIPGTWGGAWHVFGVDREPGRNYIYWDGQLIRSYQTYDNGAPQGLILNIGSSSVASYPATMQVDYVRVWTH